MNKLVLLSVLNSLGNDEDSMWCLLDGIEQTFPRGEFTFDYPAYVETCNAEFGITITYPNGYSFSLSEDKVFFGYAPTGTKIVASNTAMIIGSWYKLIKIDTKE